MKVNVHFKNDTSIQASERALPTHPIDEDLTVPIVSEGASIPSHSNESSITPVINEKHDGSIAQTKSKSGRIIITLKRYLKAAFLDLLSSQVLPFTSDHFNELHSISMDFLTHELSEEFETADKKIVITHHVPTKINYPARYVKSVINPAFAVELNKFILQQEPDYWIYGHHHCNVSDFSLGHTRMLTNQLGYVRYNEHKIFHGEKTIIV